MAVTAATAATQQFEPLQRTTVVGAVQPQLNAAIAADVDGNGTIDILLRGGSVLIGDGQLGFVWSAPGTRIPLGAPLPFPNSFELVGDVDGDGVIDLVGTTATLLPMLQTIVRVLPGNPGGTWAQAQSVGTSAGIGIADALRDVDGDGDLDLFLRTPPGRRLLKNDGTGTFVDVTATHLPTGIGDVAIAYGDVDGDGDIDIATPIIGSLQLLRNDGTGVFTVDLATGLSGVQAARVRFGDVDADGDLDLLVATAIGAPLQLWINGGAGTFTAATTVLPAHGTSTSFTDLDADGDADLLLVVPNGATQRLQAFRNLGGLVFAPLAATVVDYGPDLGDPVLADLDGDGDRDVVLGGNLLFVDGGDQTFHPVSRQPVPFGASRTVLVTGDVDGDGFADLVAGNDLLRGAGDGYFATTGQTLPADGRPRALFDADGDGDLDLAWTTAAGVSPSSGGLMENQAGVLVALPPLPLVGDVVAADFDGDGLLDLCSESGVMLHNLGGLAFAPVGAMLTTPAPLVVADFDGDGLVDLMAAGAGWVQYRNLGGFAFAAVPTPPNVFSAVAVGDIDGDGDPDLVGGYLSGGFGPQMGVLEVWFNQPGGYLFGGFQIDGVGAAPSRIALADVDEDGHLDLVGRQVWINDGTGTFFDRQSGASGFGDVAVADLDGDGDLDLVYAGDNRASVVSNRHRHIGAPRIPVLGRPYELAFASRPGYGGGGTVGWPTLAPARIPAVQVPGLGLLHLDPAMAVVGDAFLTDADGNHTIAFVVPAIPALAGLDAFWQGVIAEPNGLRLTHCIGERLVP